MARIAPLPEAVAQAVRDGDTVAFEGFSHLTPFAAAHEVIRQGRRDLTLVRMTPDLLYDQLIGAGCGRRLIFSWSGNPGVESMHRFRDAVQNDWPVPLELEWHSQADLANRYVAGASGLPFAVLPGCVGTELAHHSTDARLIESPYTGELFTVIPAIGPDVAVIHAQRADIRGNVQLWGGAGMQKEAVLAARRSLVTVEEIVDELDPGPRDLVLPHWTVGHVSCVPGGAQPSYAHSVRDEDHDRWWDEISRDRGRFLRWLDTYVLGASRV